MQPTKAIDLFLVLAADFVVLAAREGFVFFGELIKFLVFHTQIVYRSLKGYTYHASLHHLGGVVVGCLLGWGWIDI